MNTGPAAKLQMLNRSTRCLTYGLLGFIPVIGLPFAIAALWMSGRIRACEKQMWNAARPYRIGGALCGALAAVIWGGVLMLVIARIVMG